MWKRDPIVHSEAPLWTISPNVTSFEEIEEIVAYEPQPYTPMQLTIRYTLGVAPHNPCVFGGEITKMITITDST